MSLKFKNKKLKIFLVCFLSFFANCLVSAKNSKKIERKKTDENKTEEAPQTKKTKKDVETGEGGVSYYEKSKRKAKEPHKNTKARGPMDPSNRQGEGLQNVNGSRE